MISLIFLVLFWALAYGERVTDGLVAEYRLTQCECATGTFQSQIVSSPELSLTGSCPTLDIPDLEFQFPTSQGVTSLGSPPGLESSLGDFDGFGLTSETGFTLEHYLNPSKNSGKTITLTEMKDSNDDSLFKTQILIAGDLIGLFAFGKENETAVNVFPLSTEEDIVIQTTFIFEPNENGTTTVTGCVDENCLPLNLTLAESSEVLSSDPSQFSKLSVLSTDSLLRDPVQIISFSIFDRPLSLEEVIQNSQDRSNLADIPVAGNVFVEALEDEQMIILLDSIVFFLSDSLLDTTPDGVSLVVNSNVIVGNGQVAVNLPDNVFTTTGSECVFIEPSEVVNSAFNSGVVELGCSSQPVGIKLCIREVNDEPVASPNSPQSLVFNKKDDKVALSFLPGTDVDDDEQFSLGASETPTGTFSSGGKIRLVNNIFLNFTVFNSESSSCEDSTAVTEVPVGPNGEVTFCVSPSSVSLFEAEDTEFVIEYSLIDSSDAESLELGNFPIILVGQFAAPNNNDAVYGVVVLALIALLALSLVLGVVYLLKMRAADDDGPLLGNFLGGNIAN